MNIKSVLIPTFAACAFSVNAQNVVVLPGVNIVVQVPVTYVWIAPYIPPIGGPGLGPIEQQLMFQRQLSNAARAIRDVRCFASGGLRNTTSRSDVIDRWLAASEVYTRVSAATGILKSVTVGKVINPLDGLTYQAWQVTYADEGTEKWMVFPNPLSSIKLLDTPYPGSLTLNDGVVKATSLCTGKG